MKLIFVRAGAAILLSEFGQQSVTLGDVVILGGNTLCGGEPEDHFTITTMYLDLDYMIDQVFWQYAAVPFDRLHAQEFAATACSEPAQVVPLGEERALHAEALAYEARRQAGDDTLPDHVAGLNIDHRVGPEGLEPPASAV